MIKLTRIAPLLGLLALAACVAPDGRPQVPTLSLREAQACSAIAALAGSILDGRAQNMTAAQQRAMVDGGHPLSGLHRSLVRDVYALPRATNPHQWTVLRAAVHQRVTGSCNEHMAAS